MELRFENLEILCFDLVGSDARYRFILYYRRPYHDLEAFLSIASVIECLEILYDTDATVILLGDFNMPSINWLVSDEALFNKSFFSWNFNNCETAFMKFVQTYAFETTCC